MTLATKIHDRLLANDPALSRLRMGGRVVLTVILTVLCLVLVHLAGQPLPPIAYGLAIILSVEGGIAVRDKTPWEQLKTRLLGSLVSLACVALAASLEEWRYISDPMFIVVIFAASVGRVFGPRGFAVGMFAFSAYFSGAYLRPSPSDLPLAALGPAIAVVTGQIVRTYVLPDDWRRDLISCLVAVQGRVGVIMMRLAVLASSGASTDADRRDLRQLEERLKDAVLMAEGLLPRQADGALDASDDKLTALAIKIFDAHLAAESAIVLSLEAPPPFLLIHALMERDRQLAEKVAGGPIVAQDARMNEAAKALLWLDDARTALEDVVGRARKDGFRELDPSASSAPPTTPDLSFKNPIMRAAVQITVASALAMTFGLMLSRDRWFWAVLTAFLIFTNTRSRGDAAMRAIQRSLGTFFGIAIGLGVATLVGSQWLISAPLIAMCIFLGFYFLQVSYASMTFFISIALCLIYGLMGTLTVDLLELRLEETLIGAVAGTVAAFLVFPSSTRAALDQALGRWFQCLKDLLVAVKEGRNGPEVVDISRRLDAAYRDVTVAARPLGTSWWVVTRPGNVRQTLAIFLAATYWARIFARKYLERCEAPQGEVLAALDESLRAVETVAPLGSDCFALDRNHVPAAARHLAIFQHGAILGVEMIGTMLARLYPAKP
jgi:hypothetical protein